MKVLIINIDKNYQRKGKKHFYNLAIEKIKRYHMNRGDTVIEDFPLASSNSDIIYVSCIFTSNREKAYEWDWIIGQGRGMIGGTGYNIKSVLPPEIDRVRPLINMDFATRGCIRNCPFCFVPEKEGHIRADRNLYDIWDGKAREVVLMDNNILALPEHFKLICEQAQQEKVKIDFNQGLDFRLITDEIANIISKTRISELRLALDHISNIDLFEKKLNILRRHKPCWPFVYVLAGFNSTYEDTVERLIFLKKMKCRPYLMRHENIKGQRIYNELAQWVNQNAFFQKYTYEQYKIARNKYTKKIAKKLCQ